MLNLMRWKRVSGTLAYLDAKPSGERCFYSTATNARIGKKDWKRRESWENRKDRDRWVRRIVKLC